MPTHSSADEATSNPRGSSQDVLPRSAAWWYWAAVTVFGGGVVIGAWGYPGHYDWAYTVTSTLASPKKNPAGGEWFASAWTLSMILLLGGVAAMRRGRNLDLHGTGRWWLTTLQFGLICFAFTGFDMMLGRSLTDLVHKGHELLALVAFLATYLGVVGLLADVLREKRRHALPVLLLGTPLVAIGITQFWVYLKQLDLGWVDPSWRAKGIPIWLSFAFWEWLAIGFLFAGIGLLVWANGSPDRDDKDD